MTRLARLQAERAQAYEAYKVSREVARATYEAREMEIRSAYYLACKVAHATYSVACDALIAALQGGEQDGS